MNEQNPIFEQKLAAYRQEIDALDDQLITLLKDRSRIVQKVGELKHREQPGRCPVRPGREAMQLRRVVEAFRDSLFMPAAAANVWRSIIMASLALEGEMKISLCASESTREIYWLAREYFGTFSTFIRQPNPKRVLGDIVDGKATIGVLPPLQGNADALRWWTDIPSKGAAKPKIFAQLPFLHVSKPTPDTPTAMAVGLVEPEETGHDLSFLLIEVDETVSQMRVQAALSQAGLDARWIEVLSAVPGKRHHVVEVKGFIGPEHEKFKAFAAALGGSLINTSFLGAAAAPIILNA